MLRRIVETHGEFHLPWQKSDEDELTIWVSKMSLRFSKTIRAGSREVKMKKMMLGLTASLCVAVTFAEGVESANIVG